MADLGTHAAPSLNLSLTWEVDGGDFQGSLCRELGGEVYGRPVCLLGGVPPVPRGHLETLTCWAINLRIRLDLRSVKIDYPSSAT